MMLASLKRRLVPTLLGIGMPVFLWGPFILGLAGVDLHGGFVGGLIYLALVSVALLFAVALGVREHWFLSIERQQITTAEKTAGDLAINRSQFVLESTTDSVLVLDRDWRIVYRNKRALALLRGRNLAIGVSLWDAFPEVVGGPFDEKYRWAMQHQTPIEFEEYLATMGKWFEVHAYPSPDAISLFFRDVTERTQIREQMTYLAHHDFLTGLDNRPRFRERLEQALATASTKAQVALLSLDLDEFKEVNDTWGHPFGDAVLKQMAERLRSCGRENDVVARMGGDEFAIIRIDLGSPDEAARLAQEIIDTVRAPYDVEGQSIQIGASIGIVISPKDGIDPDRLFTSADIALYCAKAARGRYRFFEPEMAERVKSRQALKADLGIALENSEFHLAFQPIFNMQAGHISSFEALLRWQHPKRGAVAPADFIPIAEETGLIVPIWEWVLSDACLEATNWPEDVGVAINLSAVQFRSASLPLRVASTLAKSGLKPERLVLEITESVLLQDSATNLAILHELRTLGVKIALDDFGTGYSSLGYLRQFPFHKIKIDRSFVKDISDSAEDQAIVEAVTKLGHTLGMMITAEGVETRQQLERIREMGCDEAQGYLLSRPVTADKVADQLESLSSDVSRTSLWRRVG